jgi:hypothetical protein
MPSFRIQIMRIFVILGGLVVIALGYIELYIINTGIGSYI